jgi:hypothetical protein
LKKQLISSPGFKIHSDMKPAIITSLLLFLLHITAYAQLDQADISTGTVTAHINAGGPLVSEFRVPAGTSTLAAVRNLVLWMGGTDAGNNLKVSVQKTNPMESDFRPGFPGIAGSGKVWKVTRAEIEAHLRDFEDNGIIDNPIPSIFAWPAYGNRNSMKYNGFDVKNIQRMLTANFTPYFGTSSEYNPFQGDFPAFNAPINNTQRVPDEMVYVPFYVEPTHAQGIAMGLNCSATFYAYYCDDADFLDNTIFCTLTFEMTNPGQVDSMYVAFLVNGQTDAQPLDFLATDGINQEVYFYHADQTDLTHPIIGFNINAGLADTRRINELTWAKFLTMPVDNGGSAGPAGQKLPETAQEYYNYMSGTFKDGNPLAATGTGYAPGLNLPATFAFPVVPTDPNGWSEPNAGNTPGERHAVASNGPVSMKPNDANRMYFSLQQVLPGLPLSDQISKIKEYHAKIGDFNYSDYFSPAIDPYDALPCFQDKFHSYSSESAFFNLYPNPSNGLIHLVYQLPALVTIPVILYNQLGQEITRIRLDDIYGSLNLDLTSLPTGCYFYVFSGLPKTVSGKIMIKH